MPGKPLKQALNECVINFDKRVLVTDLLQEYEMSYQEVHQVLDEFVRQQEAKGTKYEKCFLVSGEKLDSTDEVYTVVQGELKVKEWLKKLKSAESSLYSVELDGGSRTPAQMLKPMERCAISVKSVERTVPSKSKENGHNNGQSTSVHDIKPERKSDVMKAVEIENLYGDSAKKSGPEVKRATSEEKTQTTEAKKSKLEQKKSEEVPVKAKSEEKKPSPLGKKITPEGKKTAQKSNNKKGINSFFAPATSAPKKGEQKAVVKPPTPKKMQDFFKKQTEKPVKKESKIEDANTSVQLFPSEVEPEPEEEESGSSDEEEKLDALKRDIITSDHEIENEDEEGVPDDHISKRRRIVDSDSENEEPQQKHEKKTEAETSEIITIEDSQPTPKSETYMDDDGFVITIKPKKSNVSSKPAKKSPPLKSKSPAKSASKSKAAPPATKTKQGNIMSFFTKK